MADQPIQRMKTCTKCGIEQNEAESFFRRKPRNGRSACYEQPCNSCRNAYAARYREHFPDKVIAGKKRCYENKKDQYLAHHRARYEEKRDEILAQSKASYWDDPEAARAKARKYKAQQKARYPERVRKKRREDYESYRERAAHLNRIWYENNKEHAKLKAMDRRAHLMGMGGNIPAAQVCKMVKSQKGKCWWCLNSLSKPFHLDHRIPLKHGGPHEIGNIVVSCASCNLKKNSKMPWEMDDPRLL